MAKKTKSLDNTATTKAKLAVKRPINQPSRLSTAMLTAARSELGTQENGMHGGAAILPYLKAVRLDHGGHAWAMAFVYYCLARAAAELEVRNPLAATPAVCLQYSYVQRESYTITQAYYETTKKVSTLDGDKVAITLEMLRPGDIFLTQFSQGQWHCGIIDKVGKEIITIEGCIAAGADRPTGVYNKRRDLAQIRKIIRLE